MQKRFREFEDLFFFDLWIPDSGFWFPNSGFRFRILVSSFLVLGLPYFYRTTEQPIDRVSRQIVLCGQIFPISLVPLFQKSFGAKPFL